jgi:hypothetical protein
VPTNATVKAINVRFEASETQTSASPNVYIYDATNGLTTKATSPDISTTPTLYTLSHASGDLWGNSSISVTDVNATTFGVVIDFDHVTYEGVFEGRVDYIEAQVEYTVEGSTNISGTCTIDCTGSTARNSPPAAPDYFSDPGFATGISAWSDISTGDSSVTHDAVNDYLVLNYGTSGQGIAQSGNYGASAGAGATIVHRITVPSDSPGSVTLEIGIASTGDSRDWYKNYTIEPGNTFLFANDHPAGWQQYITLLGPTDGDAYVEYVHVHRGGAGANSGVYIVSNNHPTQEGNLVQATGQMGALGTTHITGVGTAEGTGVLGASGSTDITGVCTVDATGVKAGGDNYFGSTDITGVGTVEATGQVAASGSSGVVGVGTVETTASLARNGSTDITGVGVVETTASYTRAGSTDITGTGTVNTTATSARVSGRLREETNGEFLGNIIGWTQSDVGTGSSSWSSSFGGSMFLDGVNVTNFARREQVLTLEVGTEYRLYVTGESAGARTDVHLGTTQRGDDIINGAFSTPNTYTYDFIPTQDTLYLTLISQDESYLSDVAVRSLGIGITSTVTATGQLETGGTADITGVGTVEATGDKGASNSTDITGVGIVAETHTTERSGSTGVVAVGTVEATGNGGVGSPTDITGVVDITLSYNATRLGDTQISGIATVETTGSIARVASTDISGALTIDTTGTGDHFVSSEITGVCIINTTGGQFVAGFTDITGVCTIDTTATPAKFGTYNLSSTGTLETTATSIHTGSVHISGVGTIEATSAGKVSGSTNITGTGLVDATMSGVHFGSTQISGTTLVVATGTTEAQWVSVQYVYADALLEKNVSAEALLDKSVAADGLIAKVV